RNLEAWETGVVRRIRTGKRRVFNVDSVELSVSAVVGIEIYGAQNTSGSGFEEQLVKQTRPAVAPVEVQRCFGFLCVLVEDIERPIQVVDKQTLGAAGFFMKSVNPGEHRIVIVFPVDEAGDWHRGVIPDLEDQLGRSWRRRET